MFENIKQHLKPASDGKGGTYFGATGSGKTNTMLFLSRLLATHDRDVFNHQRLLFWLIVKIYRIKLVNF